MTFFPRLPRASALVSVRELIWTVASVEAAAGADVVETATAPPAMALVLAALPRSMLAAAAGRLAMSEVWVWGLGSYKKQRWT